VLLVRRTDGVPVRAHPATLKLYPDELERLVR